MPRTLRRSLMWGASLLIGLSALLLFHSGSHESAEPAPRSTERARLASPNLVLVVLDTLRRDVTSMATLAAGRAPGASLGEAAQVFQGLDTTPHLWSLAREGTEFVSAFSTAPWTVPSHASMFTGRLPFAHGCVARSPRLKPERGSTAAELLALAGYETAAFFSNPWLSDRATGLLRGFSVSEEARIGTPATLRSRAGDQGGRETLEALERWLARRDPGRPAFVFVNFLEAHLPYDPPSEERKRLGVALDAEAVSIRWAHEYNAGAREVNAQQWRRVRELYAADAAYADALLGQLLALLAAHGMDANTVLLVTSDHGENLGEHGLAEHQFSLHETLLGVPLVVRDATGRLSPGKRTEPVLTSDLFATLLDYAGLSVEPAEFSRSLLAGPSQRPRPLIAEYGRPHPELLQLMSRLGGRPDRAPAPRLDSALHSIRVGSMRLTQSHRGETWLHDLSRDPAQLHDLSQEEPDRVVELERLAKSARKEARAPESAAAATGAPALGLDPNTAAQLRSLGYAVDDPGTSHAQTP